MRREHWQTTVGTCVVHFSGARDVHTASTVVAGAAIAAIWGPSEDESDGGKDRLERTAKKGGKQDEQGLIHA